MHHLSLSNGVELLKEISVSLSAWYSKEKKFMVEMENTIERNAHKDHVFIKPEPMEEAREGELANNHWPSEDIGCQYSKGKVEVPGEYFFENDHLALLEEGGDDLQSLLRTLVVLEAQKVKLFFHVL